MYEMPNVDPFNTLRVTPEMCGGLLYFTPSEAETFQAVLHERAKQLTGLDIEQWSTTREEYLYWQHRVQYNQNQRDYTEFYGTAGWRVRGYIEKLKNEKARSHDSMIAKGKSVLFRYITGQDRALLDEILTEYQERQAKVEAAAVAQAEQAILDEARLRAPHAQALGVVTLRRPDLF